MLYTNSLNEQIMEQYNEGYSLINVIPYIGNFLRGFISAEFETSMRSLKIYAVKK